MSLWWPFGGDKSAKKNDEPEGCRELTQKEKDQKMAKDLIKSIIDNKKEKMKKLLEEIKADDERLKKILLEEQVKHIKTQSVENSVLSFACETSNKEICECLFSYIENKEKWFIELDVCNLTAIHCAAVNPTMDILQLLLEKHGNFLKDNINVLSKQSNSTPLHFACVNNRAKSVQWLLDNGADYTLTNSKGELPLHWAAKGGNEETFITIYRKYAIDDYKQRKEHIEKLVLNSSSIEADTAEKGVDPTNDLSIENTIKENLNKEGKNLGEFALKIVGGKEAGIALLFAAKKLNFECMETILNLQKLSDATARDDDCETALHYVCSDVTEKKLLKLVTKNGDLDKKMNAVKGANPSNDYKNDTQVIKEVQHEAGQEFYTAKLSKLLKANALLGVKNEMGNSPLDWISYETTKKLLDQHIEKKKLKVEKDTSEKDKYKIMIKNFFGHHASGSDMKNILALANSRKHEQLALHPFCTSIVSIKWQKMQKYFLIKLLFFIPLIIAISMYTVFVTEKNSALQENSTEADIKMIDSQVSGTWYALYILLMIQVIFGTLSVLVLIGPFIRESQAYTSQLNYRRLKRLFEFYINEFLWSDWHEYIVWILTFLLLHSVINPIIVVIFAWFSLFRVASNHPSILPYRYILFIILLRYIKFFIFSFGLLAGFGMGFYLLINGCKTDDDDKKSCVDGAFDDVSSMVLKIPSMMMGEITYDSFPLYHAFPAVYIIFAGFIFLITCCLFNMMNGIAIDITETLLAKSEIFKIIAQCEMITEFEILLKAISSWLRWCGCCNMSFFNPIWIEVLEIYPSSGKCLVIQDDKSSSTSKYHLSRSIITEAKVIGEQNKSVVENNYSDDEDSDSGDEQTPPLDPKTQVHEPDNNLRQVDSGETEGQMTGSSLMTLEEEEKQSLLPKEL